MTGYDFSEITKSTPEKLCWNHQKNNAGRNSPSKSLYVLQGGGHKRAPCDRLQKRNKDNVEGVDSLNRVRSKPYSKH